MLLLCYAIHTLLQVTQIKNREEAIAVLRDMVQRKKEMEKQVQEEFAKVRKEAENS